MRNAFKSLPIELQQVLDKLTDEQLDYLVEHNELPAIKLAPEELEIIKGGIRSVNNWWPPEGEGRPKKHM